MVKKSISIFFLTIDFFENVHIIPIVLLVDSSSVLEFPRGFVMTRIAHGHYTLFFYENKPYNNVRLQMPES